MMFPTIHLNGTSAGALLDDLQVAQSALIDAANALRKMSPNGRDYYPQDGAPALEGISAITVAMLEHQSRIDKIRSIIAELDQIARNILEQDSLRRR